MTTKPGAVKFEFGRYREKDMFLNRIRKTEGIENQREELKMGETGRRTLFPKAPFPFSVSRGKRGKGGQGRQTGRDGK